MTAQWEERALGDLCSFQAGGAFPRSEQGHVSGDFPFIKVSDMTLPANSKRIIEANNWVSADTAERMRLKLVPAGAVAFAKIGEGLKAERLRRITRPTAMDNNMMAAVSKPGRADERFLLYLIESVNIASWAQGSALPYLSQSVLSEIPVRAPELAEQRAIAAVLGALDDKIESNRQVVDQALALTRAHIDRATEGRPTEPYAARIEVLMGSAFKGDKFSAPGVGRPLLRIRDLKTFESQTWTTEERKDETIIRPGDIVVGMDAEFRATLWVGRDSMLNQRVCSFRGKPGVSRAFVLAALEPELAFQEKAKTGTTVIHLNKADIDTFEVPELSDGEHRDLSALTEPLIDLAVARALETCSLAAVRDALLPELLSGRIQVPVEAAA